MGLVNEVEEQVNNVVNMWCPTSDKEENMQQRMLRALLAVSAYTMDFEKVRYGKEPIRTNHPLPLQNTEKLMQLIEKLKDPKSRGQQTMLQKNKMFDTWVKEAEGT